MAGGGVPHRVAPRVHRVDTLSPSHLRTALLAAALSLGAAAAQANAVFDFSFENEDGSVPGTVAGQVTLPDGDGAFAALAFIVTQAPPALGYSLPLSLLEIGGSVESNTFVVTGGVITDADFSSSSSRISTRPSA